MATLDTSNRHVLDRREGGRKISYLVPGRTRKEMEPYLATHEFLIKLVDRETVDVKFFQGYVRAYTEAPTDRMKGDILDDMLLKARGKLKAISMMLQGQGDASNKEEAPIEKLLEMWLSEKTMNYPYRNDFTEIEKRKWEKSIRELRWRRDLLAKFFADSNVKYVSGLGGGLDAKYIKWRGDKKFDGRKANTLTGDETIKREVCILRQLTDMAAREGWETRPNTFKTKVKRGLKKKVRAYEYAEQKRILEKFAGNGLYHDAALFLLVTGIRVSEFETLMHAKAWDGSRMMHIPGTKTESADREIPVCDTMRKLWERGYIFKANAQSFQGAMKKLKIQEFKPNKDGEISATHSLRHSYVVNKLKAGISSNYVQEWSGHSAAEFTKGRYGKFNRKDMSEDYDKDIADAKAHLDWLENHYFE